MSSTISTRECPICLGKFRNPVVTPCGHLTCEPCINAHVRRSSHPYEATCPSCRASFPTVLADLSTIPSKYHVFISPPLRRVYQGGMDDSSQVVIDGLKSEITTLEERVATLNRDKESLSKDLLESRSTVSRLASTERAARLSLDDVKEVARLANQRLEALRAEHDRLKSRGVNSSPVIVPNRTSGQVALDNAPLNSIGSSSQEIDPFKDRPIRQMPKRANRQSMRSLVYGGRRDVNGHAGYRICCFALALVLGLVWYTSAKWSDDMKIQ